MAERRLAIQYFRRLVHKQIVNKKEFSASIDTLRAALNYGLEDREVEILIDALVKVKGLSSQRFQDVLKCVVPRQTIASNSGLKILQWIFTSYVDGPINAVITALEWMIGLIEFELIDVDAVHAFYHHFFVLINVKNLAKFACKLIYLLTRYNDVTRWRVKSILTIENKFGKQNYLTALLGLFKSYKPECVPEKVPAISLEFAFRNIGKMNAYFHCAHQRGGATNNMQKRKITWNTDQVRKKRVRGKWNAIPYLDYIHFESARYRQRSLPSIQEFQTLVTLGTQVVDMPCNLMSLLQNEAGIHVLSFADRSYQSRFSFNLYHILYRAFIQEESEFSHEEKEKLLTQIVKLEDYMQQGIPVVSRFLAEYMHIWDGDDYRDVILNLLQWITFTNYPELYDIILVHMRRIFICADIEMKILILRMFSKFVQNLIVVGMFRRDKTIPGLFLEIEVDSEEIETLELIITYISDLCELGVRMEPSNYMILTEILNFFEIMTFLEEEHKLPMWTMMPPSIVYHGLVSRSALILSRVCGLLLKYENVNPRLKSMNLRKKFTEHINNQRLYLADFNNSLLKGKCFNEDSYITCDVDDKYINNLAQYVNPDVALLLQNHFALQPYIATVMQASDNFLSAPFDKKDMEIVTECYLQDIHKLIELQSEL